MSGLLLTCLQEHANTGGLVVVREDELLQRLNVSAEALVSELGALEVEGAIRILSPRPYFVLKLRKWSGKALKTAQTGHSAYSYSKRLLQPKQLIDSNRQEADEPVEASEGLMAEILETLGESDPAAFQKAIELYSPHVIRATLKRVARARSIHKSRTALFRHLLPRLARELLAA